MSVECYYCYGAHRSSGCPTQAIRDASDREAAGLDRLEGVMEANADAQDRAARATAAGVESLGRIEASLANLSEAFEQAHIEQMWASKMQLDVLVGVRDSLRNPRATAAEELLQMARQCLTTGMLPEGLKLLDEAVEKNPLDYRLYVTRGLANVQRDQLDKALFDFQYALRNARDDAMKQQALLLLTRTETALGQHKTALGHAIDALAIETAKGPVDMHGLAAYEGVRTIGAWRRAGTAPEDVVSMALELVRDVIDINPHWFRCALAEEAVRKIPGLPALLQDALDRLAKTADVVLDELKRLESSVGFSDGRVKAAEQRLENATAQRDFEDLRWAVSQALEAGEQLGAAALSAAGNAQGQINQEANRDRYQAEQQARAEIAQIEQFARQSADPLQAKLKFLRSIKDAAASGDTLSTFLGGGGVYGGIAGLFTGCTVGAQSKQIGSGLFWGLVLGGTIGAGIGLFIRQLKLSSAEGRVSEVESKLSSIEGDTGMRVAAVRSRNASVAAGADARSSAGAVKQQETAAHVMCATSHFTQTCATAGATRLPPRALITEASGSVAR